MVQEDDVLAPYLRNEHRYRLAVFCIVSALTRRFERTQAQPGKCMHCLATLRKPGFHSLQLVLPLCQDTLDLSGYKLNFWNFFNNPLRLAPLLRSQVCSLPHDLSCPPPPPPQPFVSLHYPQRFILGVLCVVRKLLLRALE